MPPGPTNDWCQTLGIDRPDLDRVKNHREAHTYARLIVTLLESGEPMRLVDVATRFEAAGISSADRALRSLQRCKPARAPVYRTGDLYSLDPHDDELDLWAFRLGLRPPKATPLRLIRPAPPPLPGPDVRLSVAELDEAWSDAGLHNWSTQRLALAVLDAVSGSLAPGQVVDFVASRTKWHGMVDDSAMFRRKSCPIHVEDTGDWTIAPHADEAMRSTRRAVRARLEAARRRSAGRRDPSINIAQRKAAERRRAANARQLAALSRALLVAAPPKAPQAVTLLDIDQRELHTFFEPEFDQLRAHIARYDIVGAERVRALLDALNIDTQGKRLAELGPPQKTKTLNKQGRTLKITTKLLVQGSCGIGQPFGDPKKIESYLAKGEHTKLRRRLEADVKSLHALYEYGRLHGSVRLKWGFLDERLPAPWTHRDEPTLYSLKARALQSGQHLEVVTGSAPGWTDPWARAVPAHVKQDPNGYRLTLLDQRGVRLADADVQCARLVSHSSG